MSTLQDWVIDNIECIPQELLNSPIQSDNWYISDKYGNTDGWLNKPQYRILQINDFYLVFDETESRVFKGVKNTLDDAIDFGESIV